MKVLLITTVLLFSTSSFALDTTLEFKLTGEIYKGIESTELNLAALNKELVSKKLPPLPEVVVWGKTSFRSWRNLLRRLRSARRSLKKEIDLVLDRGYFYEFPEMCYRGNASEVPKVIEALMGTVFHPDQGIQGHKLGRRKVVHNRSDFFENNKTRMKTMLQHNPQEVKRWLSYKKSSDTVLLLSDYGPHGEGTELTLTEIKRCN